MKSQLPKVLHQIGGLTLIERLLSQAPRVLRRGGWLALEHGHGQRREILAARLLTTHNLHFYLSRMERLREAIPAGRFAEEARSLLAATEPATA